MKADDEFEYAREAENLDECATVIIKVEGDEEVEIEGELKAKSVMGVITNEIDPETGEIESDYNRTIVYGGWTLEDLVTSLDNLTQSVVGHLESYELNPLQMMAVIGVFSKIHERMVNYLESCAPGEGLPEDSDGLDGLDMLDGLA